MFTGIIIVGDTFTVARAIVFAGRLTTLFTGPPWRALTSAIKTFALVVAFHCASLIVAGFTSEVSIALTGTSGMVTFSIARAIFWACSDFDFTHLYQPVTLQLQKRIQLNVVANRRDQQIRVSQVQDGK